MYPQRVSPFLTFNGQSEEAMSFYLTVFPEASINRQTPYADAAPGFEKKILHGALSLFGQEIIFLDMVGGHEAPAFNWANSLMVTCASEQEFDHIFKGLSQGGSIMMGPESVGEIRKCAWVIDKFGVTWQPVWK